MQFINLSAPGPQISIGWCICLHSTVYSQNIKFVLWVLSLNPFARRACYILHSNCFSPSERTLQSNIDSNRILNFWVIPGSLADEVNGLADRWLAAISLLIETMVASLERHCFPSESKPTFVVRRQIIWGVNEREVCEAERQHCQQCQCSPLSQHPWECAPNSLRFSIASLWVSEALGSCVVFAHSVVNAHFHCSYPLSLSWRLTCADCDSTDSSRLDSLLDYNIIYSSILFDCFAQCFYRTTPMPVIYDNSSASLITDRYIDDLDILKMLFFWLCLSLSPTVSHCALADDSRTRSLYNSGQYCRRSLS